MTTEKIAFILMGWFIIASLLLFAMMGRDKRLSKTHERRIPEATLFLFAFLGGALGGCVGMQLFRHKTKHTAFVLGFPLITLLQWGLAIWLLFTE